MYGKQVPDTVACSADSAFTERILGVPGENYKAYVEADATQRARHVPSHSMYLLHGLADITAPYHHGVALARALAEAGIIFRYQVSFLQGVFFITGLSTAQRAAPSVAMHQQ